MQPTSPLDIINTNAQLWQTMTEQYVDVVPRVAAAVTTVTQPVDRPCFRCQRNGLGIPSFLSIVTKNRRAVWIGRSPDGERTVQLVAV